MANGSRLTLAPDAPLTLVTLGAAALHAHSSSDRGPGVTARAATGAASDSPDTAQPASSHTIFELGKPLALITYLACAPDRSVAREHLLDLLWGDVEPEAAKHALRQTLWYIRKRLGERPLITGGDVLTLVGDIEGDRDRFLAAAECGDTEEAVRLFTGDFFPGFAAPGGAEFERWADVERQRLRSLFWRSAETAARRWMSTLRLREAVALARRVRDTDPLREAGWRLLFEALVAAQDTVGGTLEADAFDRLAAAEGIEPEPATRAMLRTVRQTPAGGSESPDADRPSFVAELVGREAEFAQLLASWEAARGGKATHVHVLAAAGLGKTRLLSDVHARLRSTRTRTVFVRVSLGARDIPFGLAGDLAAALARLSGARGVSTGSARALVALNPALSASYPAAVPDVASDSADALRRRMLALRELIATVAEEQPIAIFIDDTQWADTRSRQLIAGIAGALERVRVLLVTASRPTVDDVTGAEHTQTIRLAPLTTAGVGALVASIAALPPEPWAEYLAGELCDATGGSPLLVLETLQLAIEGAMLGLADGAWRSADPRRLFVTLQAGGALRQRVERLARVERWVLTLLAVAAVPLTRDALTVAAGRTDEELVAALGSLERRGLAAHHGEFWSPSHDEIASMAVELATDDARRAAARALGRMILDVHGGNTRALRHAGGLLVQAGDRPNLAVAFGRFAHMARAAGDRRPNGALADDFVGERATSTLTRGLVATLPFAHRIGLYSGRRQALVAAAFALIPLGHLASVLIPRQRPPDVVLAAGEVGTDSVARLYKLEVRADRLVPGSTISPGVGRRPDWQFVADPQIGVPVRRPGSDSWTIYRVEPDSGGVDLFEIGDGGRVLRLTAARGDDESPSWSPDARAMAFHTARWNARSRYDIAILDLGTSVVRQLTSGDDSDTAPAWSPDGSRIAFARRHWDDRPGEVCVIDVDGGGLRCFASRLGALSPLGAWYDAEHVLIALRRQSDQALARLDIESGAVDTIAVSSKSGFYVSPDGRWAVCRCGRVGFSKDAFLLFPVDEPNRAVEVDVPVRGGVRTMFGWVASGRSTRWADTLRVETGLGRPVAGVAHLLSAIGITSSGDRIPVGSVRWRSLDTTVATIDSTGLLRPRRQGTVIVAASMGGWRAAQRPISIGPRESVDVVTEDWSAGIGPAWTPFGEPRPRVELALDGTPGFLNGGDGSFDSGVYSRPLTTSRGLVVDAWVSATITLPQWQVVRIAIDDGLDEEGLRRWKHVVGNIPRLKLDGPSCTASFPGGLEGSRYADFVNGGAAQGIAFGSVPAPKSFRHGAWFRVRVQVFPDGRCGVAINGVPITLSMSRVITDSTARVMLFGASAETKALVGPLTVAAGVSDDVDWTRLGQPVPDVAPGAPAPGRASRP